MAEDYREALIKALVDRWTRPEGRKNPDWDIDGPDDSTNPYYLTRSVEDRAHDSLMEVFTAADGHLSMRPVAITEVVDAVLAVPNPELAAKDAEIARLTELLKSTEQAVVTNLMTAADLATKLSDTSEAVTEWGARWVNGDCVRRRDERDARDFAKAIAGVLLSRTVSRTEWREVDSDAP